MKHLIIIIFALVLLSCAVTDEKVGLFERYNSYKSEIIKQKSNLILPMLSENRRNQIKSLGEKEFPILSSFPNILHKNVNHYTKIKNKIGCLTINGYGENNSPIVLSIKYLYENNEWLVDFVEIYYADLAKEFQTKGICPSES